MREPVVQQMFGRALELQRQGVLAKAEPLYRAVLEMAPQDHQAANNLGFLLLDAGRPDEALPMFDLALVLGGPAGPADLGRARSFMSLSRFAEAEPLLRAALADEPGREDLGHALGVALMGLGQWREGWPLYDELRPDTAKQVARGFGAPEWRGEPLAGKRLFVWREQGYGDQIMLARFLPLLDAARVTYAGPPALQRLFEGLPVDYVPVTERWTAGPQDYWTLPFSLPLRLGCTPENLPPPPYLTAPPRQAGGRIGVMWRGNPLPHPERSLDEEAARALLALPGAIDLDPAATGAADFQDTAEIVAGLDEVISIDTSVAHLAGALGKPLRLLLPARHADWRWMAPGRADSPWYPKATLYWQERPGEWGPVVRRVLDDVAS